MSDYNSGFNLKVCYGHEYNLPQQLHLGTIYFTTDTYKMFVDLPNGRTLIASGKPVPIYPNDKESKLVFDIDETRDIHNKTVSMLKPYLQDSTQI